MGIHFRLALQLLQVCAHVSFGGTPGFQSRDGYHRGLTHSKEKGGTETALLFVRFLLQQQPQRKKRNTTTHTDIYIYIYARCVFHDASPFPLEPQLGLSSDEIVTSPSPSPSSYSASTHRSPFFSFSGFTSLFSLCDASASREAK